MAHCRFGVDPCGDSGGIFSSATRPRADAWTVAGCPGCGLRAQYEVFEHISECPATRFRALTRASTNPSTSSTGKWGADSIRVRAGDSESARGWPHATRKPAPGGRTQAWAYATPGFRPAQPLPMTLSTRTMRGRPRERGQRGFRAVTIATLSAKAGRREGKARSFSLDWQSACVEWEPGPNEETAFGLGMKRVGGSPR